MPRARLTLLLCLACAVTPRPAAAQAVAPYRDATRPPAERVRDLLARMTPDEKFWQPFMIPGDLDSSAYDYSQGVFGLQIGAADSSARAARSFTERVNAIQKYFVEQTRLGIPIIPFEEALHGLVGPGALRPGETGDVTFRLTRDGLEILDRDMRRVLEPGRYRIMIGASSTDIRRWGILRVGDTP